MPLTVSPHASGNVLRGMEFDGFSVEEVLMPPGLSLPLHEHTGTQIYFVLEGHYQEDVHGASRVLAPGDAWFRPSHAAHSNSVLGHEPAVTLIATFEQTRVAALDGRATSARELQSILLNEVRSEIVREIRRDDPATSTAVEGWALLLLSRAQRILCAGDDLAPRWLRESVELIERSYRKPISLAQVAGAVHVHPATLAAGFRRHCKTSVGEFIRKLRLEHAREELLNSERPLKQLALEAGFYDQAHFGRHFKRRFGISPASLRTRSR